MKITNANNALVQVLFGSPQNGYIIERSLNKLQMLCFENLGKFFFDPGYEEIF